MVAGISFNHPTMVRQLTYTASPNAAAGASAFGNTIGAMSSAASSAVQNEPGFLKKGYEFLFGNWGPTLGQKLRTFLKDGGKFKDFEWIKNYKDITSTAAKESAKKAAENAGKGFFKKMLGFGGKILGPALFLGPAIFSAINELKEGNIGGAVKEIAKGTISMLGFTLGGIAAAALLGTGGWMVAVGTFVISSAVGMGIDMATRKVLGPSTAEAKAELAKQQEEQNAQQNPFAQTPNIFAQAANKNRNLASFGKINPSAEMAYVDAIAKRSKEIFDHRNDIMQI